MARNQRTVQREGALHGRALHGGREVEIRLKPAAPDTGVVFVRTDVPGGPRIAATRGNVAPGDHRTTLRGEGGATVDTVEHLLACCMGLSVDNLVVEVPGPELPGMDGSAKEFASAFERIGVVEQPAPKATIQVTSAFDLAWEDGDKWFAVAPRDGFKATYTYAAPGHVQTASFVAEPETFRREIAPARTFVLESHVAAAQANGEGLGADPSNTVVLKEGGGTGSPMRFPNECARHKILDLLGDLFLAGADVLGTVHAHRTGHRENARLVDRLRSSGPIVAAEGATRRGTALDPAQIRRILPHRYPMLLVDRVVEIEGFQRAVGLKNVTFNEPYFPGHYPEQPIMPGVLLVEAMAQLAGLLLLRKLELTGRLPVLLSIDRVKFRRAVVPGDQVRLEAETVRLATGRGRVQCKALVQGALAAEARLNFALTQETRP
jgi:UDP-3-O-[3-hydroxymyristoyl] N-acetylglucosamine deacetylase / 3-hydroxyacyl-[acyl-carrier-protein] dehydratase